MRRLAPWSLLLLCSGSALASLYHAEYLRGHHGPGLIDCAHGFSPAIHLYFERFARADGLSVQGSADVILETPMAPISRFQASVSGKTFHGFVFLDPTMTEVEEEPWEGSDIEDRERVCSMVFVDDAATEDEQTLLDRGWHSTLERLAFDDPTPAKSSGRKR
ncbi:MAG: hypothetical protein ACYCWW_06195 [Deltaproteobacteria bacterium]